MGFLLVTVDYRVRAFLFPSPPCQFISNKKKGGLNPTTCSMLHVSLFSPLSPFFRLCHPYRDNSLLALLSSSLVHHRSLLFLAHILSSFFVRAFALHAHHPMIALPPFPLTSFPSYLQSSAHTQTHIDTARPPCSHWRFHLPFKAFDLPHSTFFYSFLNTYPHSHSPSVIFRDFHLVSSVQ